MSWLLACKGRGEPQQSGIHPVFAVSYLGNGHAAVGSIFEDHDGVCLTGFERVDGGNGKLVSHHAIINGGRAAALHMTKDSEARFHTYRVVDVAGDILGHFRAFGDDSDEVASPFGDLCRDPCTDGIEVVFDLWNQANFGPAGEGGGEGKISAMSSHDLHDEGAGEGGSGVANGIDGLTDDVECGIHAEAVVGSGNVIVDGGGNASEGDVEVGVELVEGAEGAVSTDDD